MAAQPKKRRDIAVLSRLSPAAVESEIFDPISNGEPLTVIAERLNVMRSALSRFLERPENGPEYMRARERAAMAHAEATITIADETREDLAAVAKARMRIQVRHFLARSFNKGLFGESANSTVNINLAQAHAEAVRRYSAETTEPLTIEAQPDTTDDTQATAANGETPIETGKPENRENLHVTHATLSPAL